MSRRIRPDHLYELKFSTLVVKCTPPQTTEHGWATLMKTSIVQFALLVSAGLVSMQATTFQAASGPTNCLPDNYGAPSICTEPAFTSTPAPGLTFADPDLGGTIVVKAAGVHQYSGISPLSANGRYLHTMNAVNGGSSILDASTGAVINSGGNVPYPECHWSNTSDDVCYYTSPDGPMLMRYHVSTNSSDVLIDYTGRFTGVLSDGATTDISKDEWMAFWASDQHTICAVDLNQQATYCADYQAANPLNQVQINNIDYVAISRGIDSVTGKRYVLVFGDSVAIYSVDPVNHVLVLEARPEAGPSSMGDNDTNNFDGVCQPGEACPTTPHGDVFESADGQQYFAFEGGYEGQIGSNYFCDLTVVAVRLNAGGLSFTDQSFGGGMTRIVPVSACGNTWQSYHLGCARTRSTCVVSTDGGAYAVQDGNTPYLNELFLMDVSQVQSPVITQLAQHRSSESSYWPQPRASLNFGGNVVVFDSDFGGSQLFVNYASVAPGATILPGVGVTVVPPPVTVAVTPGTATLAGGQKQQFRAQVTGTSNTAVKWSVSPNLGTISAAGIYTAPARITDAQTVTITATSSKDPSKSASATIQLVPVTVTVSPRYVSLNAGQACQFAATVTGTSNTAVSWVLTPAFGQLSASGLYQAPRRVGGVYAMLLTVISKQDPSKRDFAFVLVNP